MSKFPLDGEADLHRILLEILWHNCQVWKNSDWVGSIFCGQHLQAWREVAEAVGKPRGFSHNVWILVLPVQEGFWWSRKEITQHVFLHSRIVACWMTISRQKQQHWCFCSITKRRTKVFKSRPVYPGWSTKKSKPAHNSKSWQGIQPHILGMHVDIQTTKLGRDQSNGCFWPLVCYMQ